MSTAMVETGALTLLQMGETIIAILRRGDALTTGRNEVRVFGELLNAYGGWHPAELEAAWHGIGDWEY